MLRSLYSTQPGPQLERQGIQDNWSAWGEIPVGQTSAETGITAIVDRPEYCPSPLAAKMSNFVELSGEDMQILERLGRNPRIFLPEQNLVQEGTNPGFVCLVASGLAYRYKMLPCGHRQILGYLVPGDICDLGFMLSDRADYSVAVVVESRIVKLPIARLVEAMAESRSVRWALELAAHLDHVILREWLLNVGQRKAHQKLSHFLCEIAERLRLPGEVGDDGSFDFPFSQTMLADTIGTTPVHVNRMLQRLRQEGLITLSRRRLRIVEKEKLFAIANFEADYLKVVKYRHHDNAAEPNRSRSLR